MPSTMSEVAGVARRSGVKESRQRIQVVVVEYRKVVEHRPLDGDRIRILTGSDGDLPVLLCDSHLLFQRREPETNRDRPHRLRSDSHGSAHGIEAGNRNQTDRIGQGRLASKRNCPVSDVTVDNSSSPCRNTTDTPLTGVLEGSSKTPETDTWARSADTKQHGDSKNTSDHAICRSRQRDDERAPAIRLRCALQCRPGAPPQSISRSTSPRPAPPKSRLLDLSAR